MNPQVIAQRSKGPIRDHFNDPLIFSSYSTSCVVKPYQVIKGSTKCSCSYGCFRREKSTDPPDTIQAKSIPYSQTNPHTQ